MLFALSWVISENKLTTPKSTMNVIAADIRLFFSLIFQTNYLSHFIHHSTLNIQHWRKSTLSSFITQHSTFFCSSLFDFDLMTSHTPEKTRMTATPCGSVKTLSPTATLTMTETMGCT